MAKITSITGEKAAGLPLILLRKGVKTSNNSFLHSIFRSTFYISGKLNTSIEISMKEFFISTQIYPRKGRGGPEEKNLFHEGEGHCEEFHVQYIDSQISSVCFGCEINFLGLNPPA
ncbi:hypothetical protein CDAR_96601 [Caerostris darwini]|uniref:Uncharacterized protein n=1 Tax=Caerostris darwini TaxID=1538125 RepID=A0AAV4QTP8_9ARAC|nr:hypothetical protein CDAR_96601 [Caerostris darwini]